MLEDDSTIQIRPADDLDISAVTAIDERIGGVYRPEHWERRLGYYLRRDPEASLVAEIDGEVVGFMLGEVRSGEFGLDEATGWIEVLGVHPDYRGRAIGRLLGEAILDHFRAHDVKTVRTFVDQDREDLTGFFRALGFEPARLTPLAMSLQPEAAS